MENVPQEETEAVETEEVAETEAKEVAEPEQGEAPQEKFELPETAESETKTPDGDDSVEIVHNGQVHKITKEKMVELAQKGFDYDVKVGPHGKLAQMIDSDPGLSEVVDDYWQKKVSGDKPESEAKSDFTVKSLDEFDNEEDWLKENLSAFAKQHKPPALPPSKTARPGMTAAESLQMRDPEFFDKVYPHLDEYAESLSVKEYRQVDSDMGALYKFYDFVKGQLTAAPKSKAAQGFRSKSGGGEAPKSSNLSPAWKMSKADFQKQLDKIKGF